MKTRILLVMVCALLVSLIGGFGFHTLRAQTTPVGSEGYCNYPHYQANCYITSSCVTTNTGGYCFGTNQQQAFQNYQVVRFKYQDCTSSETLQYCSNYNLNSSNGQTTQTGRADNSQYAVKTCETDGYFYDDTGNPCGSYSCSAYQYLYNNCIAMTAQPTS